MVHLYTSKGKTKLLGRLHKCTICGHRNTDIVYLATYSSGSDYTFVHSDCEKKTIEAYQKMYDNEKMSSRFFEKPSFIEDCKSRGITDKEKIYKRGSKIEYLLNQVYCTSGPQINFNELKEVMKNLHK
ncbi:MAG TPA: hypothetical protein P5277_01395 [Candidatus Paceibacterota bacterium]|nr:hypothetical protein [Candidatus Paceibacterota bacterium]